MSDAKYYEILEVEKNVDDVALKAAFRKKAMETHPDRNQGDPGAEAKFKAVNEAYQVLSDPQKRAAYDRNPTRGDFSSANANSSNVEDIFAEMFGTPFRRSAQSDTFEIKVQAMKNRAKSVRENLQTIIRNYDEFFSEYNKTKEKISTEIKLTDVAAKSFGDISHDLIFIKTAVDEQESQQAQKREAVEAQIAAIRAKIKPIDEFFKIMDLGQQNCRVSLIIWRPISVGRESWIVPNLVKKSQQKPKIRITILNPYLNIWIPAFPY